MFQIYILNKYLKSISFNYDLIFNYKIIKSYNTLQIFNCIVALMTFSVYM